MKIGLGKIIAVAAGSIAGTIVGGAWTQKKNNRQMKEVKENM